MSQRSKLAKEIHILEEEIKALEIKRSRSQASLIEALISRRDPDPTDAEFFRMFTAEIDVKRENLQNLRKAKGMSQEELAEKLARASPLTRALRAPFCSKLLVCTFCRRRIFVITSRQKCSLKFNLGVRVYYCAAHRTKGFVRTA